MLLPEICLFKHGGKYLFRAVKGAVIPLIFWAVLCHDCPAEPMLKASLTYGLIGLVVDGLDTHRQTLSRGGGRRVSVGWAFSF